MGNVTVKNAVDTWVNQLLPTKNYNLKARLWMSAQASNNKNVFMYFSRPFPLGSNIISAKLRVYAGEAWAGSNTLTVALPTVKWGVNKVQYPGPAVAAGAVTVTQSGTAAGALYEVDVTTLMQTISAGGQQWYGFRITTNATSDRSIYSAQATVGALRPALVVVWSDAPDEPDSLRPSSGRYGGMPSPYLTWSFSDVNGDQNLSNVQVQIATTQALADAGTPDVWDSGTWPSTEPQLDLRNFQELLTDPSFEAGIVGWTTSGVGTGIQGTAQARTGTKSFQVTSASTTNPIPASPLFPISPGQIARGSIWARSAATARTIQGRVSFYDSTGAFISDSAVTNLGTTTTTGWTQMSTPGYAAPAGATQFRVRWNTSVTVASEVHYYDDASISWGSGAALVPMTTNTLRWWRCRNQDGSGLWSPWADSVQMGYLAPPVVSAVLVSGSSTVIQEGSPTVSWTFTGSSGSTQAEFQVSVARADNPNYWIWTSGKTTGSQTSVNIPWGVLEDASASYIFTVRVWDNANREAIPTMPVFAEASTSALAFAYSAGITNITGLSFTADPVLPKGTLNFNRATAPDYFQLQRSDDGGTTWTYVDEALPAEIFVSGTAYAWVDTGAKQYISHQWRVIPVVAGVQGQGLTVSGTIARLCPVLMRKDGSNACFFINPERSRQRNSIQGLAERMGGPPVLVTQRTGAAGGQSGHVKGRFVDEAPGGSTYTAVKQKANFLALEADSGQTMRLAVANETLDVVAFNFNLDVLTDTQGITYSAEFDWIEN